MRKCLIIINDRIWEVDINNKEKPFFAASGDNHSDFGAALIVLDELLSVKWKTHIQKSNCSEFVDRLRKSVENGETFPQTTMLKKVNNTLIDKE